MRSARCWVCSLFCVFLAGALIAEEGKPAKSRAAKAKRRPPTVQEIDKAFRSKSDDLRIALFGKLQRAGDEADQPEIIAALQTGLTERLEKGSFETVDLRLLWLMAEFPSDNATRALTSFLSADDPRAVIIALRSLAESGRSAPWEKVLPVSKRPDYERIFALRRGVLQVAERNASLEAVDYLIDAIATVDGQLKYETARALTTLTGQEFGGQDDKWTQWWQSARDAYTPIQARDRMAGSLRMKMEWHEPVPKFYELPVYARRVLFIIDQSGSMNQLEGEESRIDRARRELEHAIAFLPADTYFDLLAFHDFVTPFSPRLVPATDDYKQHAVLFARNLEAEKNTNSYDALTIALDSDPNLEAIYFLSDGEPTTGGITEPSQIVDAITLQNQLRLTSIYCLGIGAHGVHENFLKKLAARNYGEFFRIR